MVPPDLQRVLDLAEWVVIAIFLADLVVLYKQEGSFSKFLSNCWIDIIAAISIPGIFGAFKIVRVARVARIARISHSAKFFSKKSGLNTYLRKTPRRVEDPEIDENPRETKAKKAAKPARKKRRWLRDDLHGDAIPFLVIGGDVLWLVRFFDDQVEPA